MRCPGESCWRCRCGLFRRTLPYLCCVVFWFGVCGAQLPTLSSLQQNEWSTISHSETKDTCWSGGRYDFFVRKSEFDPRAERLLIYFAGGAVCWSTESCSKQHQDPYTCSRQGISERFSFDIAHLTTLTGLFDFETAANPFANYTLVVLPQCSADGHIGQNARDEDGGKHLGANNTQATLSWVFSQVSAPETVFVVGSGTGILGSLLFAPSVRVKYPEARVVLLSDSGSLSSLEGRTNEMVAQWGAINDEYDPSLKEVMSRSMSRNESALGQVQQMVHDRWGIAIASIAFMNDQRQLQQFGGGRIAHSWKDRMLREMERLSTLEHGFVFVGAGQPHEVLQSEALDAVIVNGTRLNEWLAALATANLTTLDGNVFCDNCNIEFMEFLGNGTCVHNRTKNQPDFPSTTPAGADVFQNTTGSNATNATNSTQDVPIPRFVGCGEGGIGLDINDNSSEYNCSCGPSCVADNSCCGDFHEECEEKCAPSEASRCWAVAMHSIQSNLQTQVSTFSPRQFALR